MSEPNRLAQAPVGKLLLSISAQTTFSLLLFSVYSITDTYFVARGVGSLASAGVGVFAPLHLLLGGLATTVGTGAASVVSRAQGSGKSDKSAEVVGNTFLIWLMGSLLISVLGLLFLNPLMLAMGATAEVLPYAKDYGGILLLGAVTATGFSSVIRANGDIRYSTLQWSLPTVVNLVLDPIFIYAFHWGIRGAALATLISQLVSAATSLYYFVWRKKTPYHLRWAHMRPQPALMREVITIGLPALLNNLGASGVAVLFNNFLKVTGGSAALSAYAILNRVTGVLLTPQSGIMQGMQPLVGYNFGRGALDRVRQALHLSLKAVMAYGLGVSILCLALAEPIFRVFTLDENVIAMGATAMRLIVLAYALRGVAPVIESYFQAMGNAKVSFLLTLGSILLIQFPVLLLAGLTGHLEALWIGSAVSDALMALVAYLMHKRYRPVERSL